MTKNGHDSLPHVQSLLRSSISSSERHVISQYLENAQKDIRSHEIEINKLKAALLVLENERDRLMNRVAKYRSLLAPVHRLPTELLVHIFKYATECGDLKEQFTPTEAPRIVTLSMVCGRWRGITLSTPSLWSFINLWLFDWIYLTEIDDEGEYVYQIRDTEEISRLTRILQLFLKRSQSIQLDLYLKFALSHPMVDCETRAVGSVLDVLLPTASRWRSLTILVSEGLSSDLPALSLFQNLPSLQHLSLPLIWSGIPIGGCASMTSLCLGPSANPDMLLIPWHQIAKLHLTTFGRSVEWALDTVRSCPGVENLTLECVTPMVDPPINGPIISSRVTSFTIKGFYSLTGTGRISAFQVFQVFSFPKLSTLAICEDDINMGTNTFSDFLRRSACTITHLTIQSSYRYGSKEDKDAIIPFLGLLPTLKALRLRENPVSPTISERFNRNKIVSRALLSRLSAHQRCDSDPLFLPHLTSLTLTVYGKDLDTEALIEAVTSRWLRADSDTGINRLQTLNLELFDKFSPALEPLHYLRDAGLRVEVFGC
ncbi:hypothetical protein PQX77_013918 [Marasmius sp. AFHP31]|nr:hypothetical protein PQX77_013918 [Marasmius sp. AFHP31]